MSNIPWNRQESTVGYLENTTMAVEPKELARQYRAMVEVAMELKRSNEEIGAALTSRERSSRCSCRQTIARNLSETQRQVRGLDERMHKIVKDEDELKECVLKLKTKIDGLYKVLTSKNNTHVAGRLTGSSEEEEDFDESDEEMTIEEPQHLNLTPRDTNEVIDTDNYSSVSESLAETDNVETERLSNSLSKKYYDAAYTENVAVFDKEHSNVRWFDGLYNTSDTQNGTPENDDNNFKCETVPFRRDEDRIRKTDIENPNDSKILVSRTKTVKDLERVVTDQPVIFKGNRSNIPQKDQTHLNRPSKSGKETRLKNRIPYTNNISVDRNEETEGIDISSRRHSEVTCKPFSDADENIPTLSQAGRMALERTVVGDASKSVKPFSDSNENIPALSQNVPGHIALKNRQLKTVVEDVPKPVKHFSETDENIPKLSQSIPVRMILENMQLRTVTEDASKPVKPFRDTDENIPALSQNVPGRMALENRQLKTVEEDAPKPVKPFRDTNENIPALSQNVPGRMALENRQLRTAVDARKPVKLFRDTDENIPALSQNVPGRVALDNTQLRTAVKNAPEPDKPPKVLSQARTKTKYKRIFTSSMNDNRINFKTEAGFVSVAAGEYLEYPTPKESNIKVHSKGSTGQNPHKLESAYNDWGKEQTGSGQAVRTNHVHGPSTVLCLDLTENMEGRAYQEMIATAKNIVTGMQAVSLGTETQIQENIALTVFGYETKVIAHLTNEYDRLLTSLDMLTVGGPGDMKSGLMKSVSAFHTTVGEKDIQAKIVLISNGRTALERLQSSSDQHSTAAGNVSLWSILNNLRERAIRVFCIPVGEARLDVLEKVCTATQGRIIHQSSVHRVIKMSEAVYIATELALNFKGHDIEQKKNIIKEIGYSTTDDDSENILEQIDFIESHMKSDDGVSKHEFEEFDDSMPEIGSRVRRGPHWKWENQDSDGAGTVIGHNVKGMLWVDWDNGISNRYHYSPDHFDVIVVDEPRRLFNDLIAVGCVVKRGANWRYGNQDGGPGSYGVVIRVVRDGTVKVRWQNKQKYMYKFGCDGLFEVEVCEQHEVERARRERLSSGNIGSNGATPAELYHQKSKDTEKRAKGKHQDKHIEQSVSRTDTLPTKDNLHKPPGRSSTKEQSSPLQTVKSPTWQYWIKDKDGWWDFPSNVQEKIEKDYNRNNSGTTLITIGGTRYRLAFANMTYHNIHVKDKADLKIRRKE